MSTYNDEQLPSRLHETRVPLGVYISVPFCRSKCSYCNFASGVFSRRDFDAYIARVCSDVVNANETATGAGAALERAADSIYLGGGTPTILELEQLIRLFATVRENFAVARDAEITVECAPGTLSPEMIETLAACGVNRVSLGVQSFVDKEAAAVARLHTRQQTLADIAALRAAGIAEINVDLIAGLPHQTPESWTYSLTELIATGVHHASVYMLEVDEDSRLGREVIAGGTRYHAHDVPDDELAADFYEQACKDLADAGIPQYEISNFARPGHESRHNLKYWTRQPYIGFGVDAHSMLPTNDSANPAVRFATPDELPAYLSGGLMRVTRVSREQALEEEFFLGLRLNRGLDLIRLEQQYPAEAVGRLTGAADDLIEAGLLERAQCSLRLTPHGRLLSNEVFERFISSAGSPEPPSNPALVQIH